MNELMQKWQNMLAHCEPLSQWTTGAELAWLAEMASTRKLILEIGSYKGKSAKAMSWSCPGVIYCVDRFQDNTRDAFEKNLQSELRHGKVRLFDMDSLTASESLGLNLKFDMIFIDASHGKEDVIEDIRAWRPKLREGGLLCGHDCCPRDPNNGVSQALAELNLAYKIAVDSIWAL